jgi:hypothetical protein
MDTIAYTAVFLFCNSDIMENRLLDLRVQIIISYYPVV